MGTYAAAYKLMPRDGMLVGGVVSVNSAPSAVSFGGPSVFGIKMSIATINWNSGGLGFNSKPNNKRDEKGKVFCWYKVCPNPHTSFR